MKIQLLFSFMFHRQVIFKPLLLGLLSSLFLVACQNFQELNTDPTKVSDEQLIADGAIFGASFKQMQLGFYHPDPPTAQLQQNLNADIYSGYMAIPTPFNGDKNNTNYFMMDGWNETITSVASNSILLPALQIEKNLKKYSPPGAHLFEAWLKVLKVAAMHRVADKFGPIIYTHFGKPQSDGSFLYDSLAQAYDVFFKELGEAIDTLSRTQDPVRRFTTDLVYHGDYKAWARFANSLRLRLAMRIAFVDSKRSQQEAKKSIGDTLAGLIEENTQNFVVNMGTLRHPLNTMSDEWNDVRMGAPMEVYLKGFKDERVAKYFKLPVKVDPSKGYRGIRQGVPIDGKAIYQDTTSRIATQPSQVQLMTAAEVYFLLAEARLRGYDTTNKVFPIYQKSVQELYNEGIRQSFSQYNLSADNYIANSTHLAPADFEDTHSRENDSAFPANVKIPVALDPSSDKQKQFQQIITQKWLAMFPDGDEAWAEQRRTGYPILLPLKQGWKKYATNTGTIPDREYNNRLTIPQSERQKNPVGYAAIATFGRAKGDKDEISTRLWWDVPDSDKTIK